MAAEPGSNTPGQRDEATATPWGDARTLRSTVVPELTADDEGRQAIAVLRRVGASAEALEVHATIGEGGFAIVRSAYQRAVGREVALKTLREDRVDESSALTLLREAWVTGALEHPNVVPIYDLSIDEEGRPQILLKRISGGAWTELLRDDDTRRERFGGRDPLDWNLRILMQVASAVHFAHSRGIVHRDIKPDNIMIGPFGEVYVLDWGIAVSLEDDGTGRLPLAKDAWQMAGTPAYMAPEMVGSDAPPALSPRTDVYLLGATLFEVIAGRPPHDGRNLAEVLAQIWAGPPALPASTPSELSAIVQTAMAVKPQERFANADAFRSALSEFLEHRGSLALTEEADTSAQALAKALSNDPADSPESARIARYRLFAAARFGYVEALRGWPANRRAQKGFQHAVEAMIAFELGAGDARAASLLLSELPESNARLETEVADARESERATAMRRQQLEADLNPDVGRRTRFVLSSILCFVWILGPLTIWCAGISGVRARTHQEVLGSIGFVLVLASVLAWWARQTLSRTAVNRQLRAGIAIALVGQICLFSAAWSLGISVSAALAIKLLLYAVVAAHVSVTVNRSFWFVTASYLVAMALGVLMPDHVSLFEACANVTLTIVVFALWARPPSSEQTGD